MPNAPTGTYRNCNIPTLVAPTSNSSSSSKAMTGYWPLFESKESRMGRDRNRFYLPTPGTEHPVITKSRAVPKPASTLEKPPGLLGFGTRSAHPGHTLPEEHKFITVDQLAEMLHLKKSTIYQMVMERRIPYRKAGHRTIFLLSEILEWTKDED
jgi:excisionase family DNA binding protein